MTDFFVCDITDSDRLKQIIQDNKINIIIDLAASLIAVSVEEIEHVNSHGTQIIFDIAGVKYLEKN